MAKDRTNPLTADSVERIVAKMKPYMDADRLSRIDQKVLLQEIQRCALNYSARKGIRLTEKNLKKLARLKKLLRDLQLECQHAEQRQARNEMPQEINANGVY